MFALYYDARTRQVTALNGSGRAPSSLTLDMLHETTGATDESPLPPTHPCYITVPGACAGWCDLIERHGSLTLPVLLAPAIRLAEDGFPVGPVTSHFWQEGVEKQLKHSLNGLEMTIAGRAPRPGELFRNPGLAHTLKTIAIGGKDAFYGGEIGAAIVSTVREAGGCLAGGDLSSHVSTWDEPVSTSFGDLRLWECPPNGQGITALLALNILEGFDLPTDPLSADRLHLEIEALRLAFADMRWYVADPRHPGLRKYSRIRGLCDLDLQGICCRTPEIDRSKKGNPRPMPRDARDWFRHGLLLRRRWVGKRLLVHQLQLHRLWDRDRPPWMGFHASQPWIKFQPAARPSECACAR